MTEKKTFKNPSLDYVVIEESWGANPKWGWEVNELDFPEDEWDMEVTFTRKVKPVQVDSVVRHRNWPTWLDSGEPIYFVVKAIVADNAWIAYKDQKREDMLTSLDRLYFDE